MALMSDATALSNLEHEIFSHENFPLSKNSFYYHIKNNLLYVAQVEGKIVAYILVLIKRKNAKLYSLGILPAFRGRGLSSNLMKVALEKLPSLKFKTITLEVRTDNKNAILLYEKTGFKYKSKGESFYLDGCDAYIMEYVF